jgi:hypothetical protein
MTSGQADDRTDRGRDPSGLEVRYVARHYGEPVFQRGGRDHEIGAVIAERGTQRAPTPRCWQVEWHDPLAVYPIQPGRKRARKIRVRRALSRNAALYSPMLMTLRKRSVMRCRSNHATTIGSRSRLRSSAA